MLMHDMILRVVRQPTGTNAGVPGPFIWQFGGGTEIVESYRDEWQEYLYPL